MKSRVIACMIALVLTTTNVSVLADTRASKDTTSNNIIHTETTSVANLAEISKVEFLNNVQDKIAPPNMNIPKINVTPNNESL
ncbi:MAG: hypothetical protein E7214_01225 [Clostridium sp.]|nr:hypothetical protein [Clostridium sp.]